MIDSNNLTPSPELDRIIAEKVMGYEFRDGAWWSNNVKVATTYWSPSTIREHALQVVDFFTSLQCGIELFGKAWSDGGHWVCTIEHPVPHLASEGSSVVGYGRHEAESPSLALAICRAAVDYAVRSGKVSLV